MDFALFDNNYQKDAPSYLFRSAESFVTCAKLEEAEAAFEKIEKARNSGKYAAGFLSYELAQHFGYHSYPSPPMGFPFMQFGIYDHIETLDDEGVEAFLRENEGEAEPFLTRVTPAISQAEYDQAIQKIKSELEAGNSYQVNFTFENAMLMGGCPTRLYRELRHAQAVPYGAYLNFPTVKVLSRSPELFFETRGDQLTTRPMKGTAPRRLDAEDDQKEAEKLRSDPKQQAENLMIVDLLRNDMSKISEVGSVKVEALFSVESYKKVHQMTSTITSRLKKRQGFREILEALFPCGSITGAPKLITTKIISELEAAPRGVYCGAIGFIRPCGDMVFNVPIRTLQIDNERKARLNIGGGIVYDSVDASEFAEAKLKGAFVFSLEREFKLLEAFFYSPEEGARHFDLHMERLKKSAHGLGFKFDDALIREHVANLTERTHKASKIRIELGEGGEVFCESVPILPSDTSSNLVCLSEIRNDPYDPIWQYKTSNRALYSREFMEARRQGAYDVIFANNRGFLTEASNHNLVLRFGNQYFTPPQSAGLLPGIARQIFLEQGKIKEKELPISSLEAADEILLLSSVRGLLTTWLMQ